ncbi:MAG: sugar transferase [Pirellulaceae bacterium]|nr:sugar transferase [Pirellulaceae bacterium]
MYGRLLKPFLDRLLAFVLLIALSPLFFLVGGVVWVTMGRPLLFCEKRGGLGGSSFTFWKFRSMTNDLDAQGNLLPDENRLTNWGKWLRKTSLDELPQLWNILKGEMSFIGPRPLAARYLARYSPRQRRRHEQKPGLTGWAQVCGRNSLSWEEKFELDVWYVENISFGTDLKILVKTVGVLLGQKGIQSETSVTMEEFFPDSSQSFDEVDDTKGGVSGEENGN